MRSTVYDIALHLRIDNGCVSVSVCVCVCERERERRVGAPCLVCDTRRDGARSDC